MKDDSNVKSEAILHYDKTVGFTKREDLVATEYALTIYVNQQELATVVCTPEYVQDLVVGFLASEGIIRSIDQITTIDLKSYRGAVYVQTVSKHNFNQSFFNKRYIGSCCGKSRQSFYFYNDAQTAKPVVNDMRLTPEDVLTLMTSLDKEADLFKETGGVHIARLTDVSGNGVSRSDIGRHNALDKLYGYMLRTNTSPTGKVIVFSGRLSSEVLLKVAKLGVGIVMAKSAPTALALAIANELHITAIGFVRNDSFNVYTHPSRLLGTEYLIKEESDQRADNDQWQTSRSR